ncbi:MAG: hypothetical protein R2731_01570 [Nocardioides sp.]
MHDVLHLYQLRDPRVAGEARVRSISFHQVAYCRPCWDELHSVVPAQRSESDVLDPARA